MVGGGIDDWKFFLFVGVVDGWIFFFFVLWPSVVLIVVGAGEEKMDAGSNHNPCVVSVGWVPPFCQKVDLKVEICD